MTMPYNEPGMAPPWRGTLDSAQPTPPRGWAQDPPRQVLPPPAGQPATLPTYGQIGRIILVWLWMEVSSPVFWGTALLILGIVLDSLQHSGISNPLALKLIAGLGVAYAIGTKLESALGAGKLRASIALHAPRSNSAPNTNPEEDLP